MPFDGRSYDDPSDPILKRLLDARAKFTGPESWFKFGSEPVNTELGSVNCIGTAVGSMMETPVSEFLLELAGVGHMNTSLAVWNNAPNYLIPNEHRTYEDVIELLDRAIEKRRSMRLADIMETVDV